MTQSWAPWGSYPGPCPPKVQPSLPGDLGHETERNKNITFTLQATPCVLVALHTYTVWQAAYDYALSRWEQIAIDNAVSHFATRREAVASLASLAKAEFPLLHAQIQSEREYGSEGFVSYLEKRATSVYSATFKELCSDLEHGWRNSYDDTY